MKRFNEEIYNHYVEVRRQKVLDSGTKWFASFQLNP